jgi:ureidoacrylate peracid hydrolase
MPDVQVLTGLREKVNPWWTALLLVDMSNDLISPQGKAAVLAKRPMDHVDEVLPHIERLLAEARSAGVLIVHIQQTTLEHGLGLSGPWLDARAHATYGMLEFCMEGSWGQQTIDQLKPAAGEAVVQKYRYSGFVGTNLNQVLRSAERKTVIVCGVSTNVCVEATARDAFSHEYYVVWPRDASASWSRELHQAALESAGHRYASVCSIDELASIWGSR